MNTILYVTSLTLMMCLAIEGCSHPQTNDYCDLALKFCKDDCRNECVKGCKTKCDKEFGEKCAVYDDFEACDQKDACIMKCPVGCHDATCDVCDTITDDCVSCNENPFFQHLKQYHGL